MTLSRSIMQRLTAAIAIVAVLLLFVAPVISTSLAPQMMMADMPEMAMDQMMPSHHGDDHAAGMMDHTAMNDAGFACGYCDLLIHVPLLLWLFIPFIWLALLLSRAPPPAPIAAPLLRPRRQLYRPRAPPPPARILLA